MKEELYEAERLYKEGKWQEAISLIDSVAEKSGYSKSEWAEANRIKGWSYYYLGIKGPEEKKQENLRSSEDEFRRALEITELPSSRLSILNGLPLTLWILGEKPEALITNINALAEFTDEPSVWNTTAILIRWAKKPEVSIAVCQRVYEAALARKEYRTAGHGKHNKADALKELGQIWKARCEYRHALSLYVEFEKLTGQSAKFHIEGVEKKLADSE